MNAVVGVAVGGSGRRDGRRRCSGCSAVGLGVRCEGDDGARPAVWAGRSERLSARDM